MSKYLWCEDSKSGYQFWRAIFGELFPDVVVETKGSNTGLWRAAHASLSDKDQYYIVMDSAVDNPDVLREMKRLTTEVSEKDNVRMIRLHSFEYALLSFRLLEQWVFAEEDNLKDSRQDLLKSRELFVSCVSSMTDGASLQAFREAFDSYENKNSEQIAAKLLYEITRNTGFETNKTKLGECFVNTCCEWEERQDDDICGLDADRISSAEKAKLLVEHSVINEALKGVGL